MWKSEWKMSKEKWLLLLVCGIILLLLSFPIGKNVKEQKPESNRMTEGGGTAANGTGAAGGMGTAGDMGDFGDTKVGNFSRATAGNEESAYEKELENRVKEILKNVDGVGKVDVMLTLKSSGEKVLHVDQDKSRSSSEEKDSAGGTRKSMTEEIKDSTLVTGNGTSGQPVIEKELRPEIAGVVISAEGGGSSVVKTEISEAMEALFDIPAHKIKVLKRVE